MKRRDFLKAISAILPAAVIARMDLTPEPIAEIAVEPIVEDNGVWFQNGGVVTSARDDWMETSSYFAVGRSNTIYRTNAIEANTWYAVDLDESE